MKRLLCAIVILFVAVPAWSQDEIQTSNGALKVDPITHASLVLSWGGRSFFVDPTGEQALYSKFGRPSLILITDIHGDHMDLKTLQSLDLQNTIIVAPKAVADQLPTLAGSRIVVLNNGETTNQPGVEIEAIPMYNLPEAADSRHVKGRGNGYVLNFGGKRIYISGDTEDIPEMRALRNIDVAFVCMNLPYTMDVNQAASAVLEFKPGIVYPYHHRGQDINAFKKLVNDGDPKIDVRLRSWY